MRTNGKPTANPFDHYAAVSAAFNGASENDRGFCQISAEMAAAIERVMKAPARTPGELLIKAKALWSDEGESLASTDEILNFYADLEAMAQDAPTPAPIPSELEARDRENMVRPYISSLLRSAFDDMTDAQAWVKEGTGGDIAVKDAINAICMAEEYLAELDRLARRPIAG